jgi:hypothetical protein
MAYLIKNKGYTINEAVKTGRRMSFYLPPETLIEGRPGLSQYYYTV